MMSIYMYVYTDIEFKCRRSTHVIVATHNASVKTQGKWQFNVGKENTCMHAYYIVHRITLSCAYPYEQLGG